MIIGTMAQLGKLTDNGVELEYNCNGEWRELDNPDFNEVVQMVEEGRIRTKPRTIDVEIWIGSTGIPHGVQLIPGDNNRFGADDTRQIHTITLDEESGD